MEKSKLLKILFGILILVLLIILYIMGVNTGKNNIPNETANNIDYTEYDIINKPDSDVIEISINDLNFKTVAVDNKTEWIIEGYDGVKFNQENISFMAKSLKNLTSTQIIEMPENTDISEYKLDTPEVTVNVLYDDSSVETLYIGKETPDMDYRYVMTEREKKVYLLDELTSNRFLYTLDNFVDKDIPIIRIDTILHVNLKNKDKEEIDIKFLTNTDSDLNSIGLSTMTMLKPYEGITVYPENLQNSMLPTVSSLALGELVDTNSDNLSLYGLASPFSEITLTDENNTLHLKIGDLADEENYYCMIDNRIEVFKIKKSLIEPFININVIDFIEKFVNLVYRTDVESITINDNYNITFEDNAANETDDYNSSDDNRTAYLNGKEVEESDFSSLYQLIIGITFDSIGNTIEPRGKPDVTMIFNMLDGTSSTVNYYTYPENTNFYIAELNGNYSMLVSKQKVENVIDKLKVLG